MTTIAPADEACEALVVRINSASAPYTLTTAATYSHQEIDPLEEITGLRVDVVANTELQLSERIDGLDDTQHEIRVWIRKQLSDFDTATVKAMTLLRKNVADWLDNWDSSDKRVRVWDSESEDLEQPIKTALRERQMFVAVIVLVVRVSP